MKVRPSHLIVHYQTGYPRNTVLVAMGYVLCRQEKWWGGGSGGRHGNENENGKQVQTK